MQRIITINSSMYTTNTVDVLVPTESAKLDVVKTVDKSTAKIGDKLTYTIKVTNTGDVPLSNITITDAKLGLNGAQIATTLQAGESKTVMYTYTVTNADARAGTIVNTVTAHGTPPSYVKQPPDPSSSVSTTVITAPKLTLTKDATESSVPASTESKVHWKFDVANTGDVAINNITIADKLLSDRKVSIVLDKTSLQPGEHATGTAEMSIVHSDIDAGKVINTAHATGTSAANDSTVTSNDDDATVDVSGKPKLDIVKTVDKERCSVNDALTYTIKVTNTGDFELNNVTINDDMLGISGRKAADSLKPGESVTIKDLKYTATLADAQNGTIVNTATAHGEPPKGVDQPEDPTSTVTTTVDAHPSLKITKSADETTIEHSSLSTKTHWSFDVENNGDVPVSGISVEDALLASRGLSVTLDKTSLNPGEHAYAKVEMPVTQDDLDNAEVINEAQAHGTSSVKDKKVDSNIDDAKVELHRTAKLEISKTASAQTVEIGSSITYMITVTNTGDTDLSNVTITDEKLGVRNMAVSTTLKQGASAQKTFTYTATLDDAKNGKITNTASAHGTPPKNVAQPEDPTSSVDVAVTTTPKLTLSKGSLETEIKHPYPGDAASKIHWTFDVLNDGDIPISGITVDDDMLTKRGISVTLDKTHLEPGEHATATVEMPIEDYDMHVRSIRNDATVHGANDAGGGYVESNESGTSVKLDIDVLLPDTGGSMMIPIGAAASICAIGAVIAATYRRFNREDED